MCVDAVCALTGEVQRHLRGQARATLDEALTAFEQSARRYGPSGPEASSSISAGALRLPTLTPTEVRVAELAVSGLANREIAERAFLTTKAVEANLTRVYRQLGIRSRGGLARALQTAGEKPSSHD